MNNKISSKQYRYAYLTDNFRGLTKRYYSRGDVKDKQF